MELHVLGGGMGRGVDNAGVAEHLVDYGVCVMHVGTVSQHGGPAAHNAVNLLLDPLLHLWVTSQVVEGKCEYGGGGLRASTKDVHESALHVGVAAIFRVEGGVLVCALRHLLQVGVIEVSLMGLVIGLHVLLD